MRMKKISKKRFDKAMRNHELFLNSNGREGERAVFTFTSFEKIRNLKQRNFSKAYITHSDLSLCELGGAVFDEANISDSTFRGAILVNASFKNTTATKTDFTNADMRAVKIQNSDFRGASFVGADLFDAYIMNTELENCAITLGKKTMNINVDHKSLQKVVNLAVSLLSFSKLIGNKVKGIFSTKRIEDFLNSED